MNKLVVAVLCLLLLPMSTYAGEGFYVGGNAGLADFKDARVNSVAKVKYDTGSMFSAFLGYDFDRFRVEGEALYTKSDYKRGSYAGNSVNLSGDASNFAGLINAYIDFFNESDFVTSIMLGAGLSRVKYDDLALYGYNLSGGSDYVFCYQAGLGVGYIISKGIIMDLRYRYFATSDPKFKGVKTKFSSNNLSIGMRFYF